MVRATGRRRVNSSASAAKATAKAAGKRGRTGEAAMRADGGSVGRDAVFAAVARYFALLAEPTRLRILHVICGTEQSVSAIVRATGATQTNVSRNLALLFQAGVVSRRREGNTVYYRVTDAEVVSVCRAVCVQIAGRLERGRPLRDELLDFASRH